MIKDDIHEACLKKMKEWNERVCGEKRKKHPHMDWKLYNKKHVNFAEVSQWNHLSDAVEKGTISPMEAFDALELGYLPENLKVRKSMYSHLL